jgi:hypothetical protein
MTPLAFAVSFQTGLFEKYALNLVFGEEIFGTDQVAVLSTAPPLEIFVAEVQVIPSI